MKIRKLVVLCLTLAISGVFPQRSEARLSNNNRRAVVLEAFYALRTSYDGGCDKTINGNCVSSWNYLNSDTSAYNYMRSWFGCNSSIWRPASNSHGCSLIFTVADFFNDVASYGYGTHGGSYGPVGRGGQCRYFANLVVYRSGSPVRPGSNFFPTYAQMWDYGNGVERNFALAKPGDIITSNPAFPPHTAIVVEIKSNGLDVIDANWISDMPGTQNREVIGRHLMTFAALGGDAFGIWKGVGYYNEPYIP